MARQRGKLRKQRAVEKLAEARRRVPQMLAEEQALRDSLDDLSKRGRAMLRHAELDQAIAANIERSTALTSSLKLEIEGLTAVFGSILAARLSASDVGSGDSLLAAAESHLTKLDDIYAQVQTLSEETGQMLIDRADLGVVQIDRGQLAAGLDSMATHLETIGADLERKRAYYVSLCEGQD